MNTIFKDTIINSIRINTPQENNKIRNLLFIPYNIFINSLPFYKRQNKEKCFLNKKNEINSCDNNIKCILKIRNLLLIFIFIIPKTNLQDVINSNYSFVTLKVSGQGYKKVFYDKNCSRYMFTRPNEVYINQTKQDKVHHSYDLNSGDIVKLVWNETIMGCGCMFQSCDSIIEINFTNFDTSQSKYMNYMFTNCKSLKSLDLSSFNTNNVEVMNDMFGDCHSLISLNMTNFNTSNVVNMGHMFYNCRALRTLDISFFNISKVGYIDNMFNGCINLISINLSNFDTSKVLKMSKMFNDCISLTSLDISNFDTSLVTDMEFLFNNCISLVSINISNFNLKKTKLLKNMFNNCSSLKYLDFSNIEINTNPQNFSNLFFNCSNLEYIGLKYFKSSDNIDIDNHFFEGASKFFVVCTNDSKLINIAKNYYECSAINCFDNWYDYKKKVNTENDSCIDDCSLTNYKYEYNNKCYLKCLNGTYNNNYKCEECHQDCEECEGPYSINNTNCTICSISDKFLYFGNCIDECENGFYINEITGQRTCKCELTQCHNCSTDSLNKSLCTYCDTENGYYPVYDSTKNKYYPYLNFSKFPKGYYFDNEELVYKPCFSSCDICNISGNEKEHNCIKCKKDFIYERHFDIYKNCYNNCSFFHYYDEKEKKLICTETLECPKEYELLIESKKECLINCANDDLYRYEFRKKCYKECPNNSTLNEKETDLTKFFPNKKFICKPLCNDETPFEIINTQECVKNCPIKNIIEKSCIINNDNYTKEEKEETEIIYDIMLDNIEIGFTSKDYNFSYLEQGNNDIIEFGKMTVTLSTIQNQKNGKNKTNVTTIDLGQCEYLLKKAYNISENETLFMKKVDVLQEGMKIPKIEFDVYYKLNKTNLAKLNLSYCINTKIIITVPATINESLDILNSSSGYYNDLCYTTTSDVGTDITLKDRKNDFIEKNKTLCQENCVFSEYNYEIQKADCLCDVFESSSSFSNIKINKTKLYKNFIDIKNIMNINLLICYQVLFSQKGLSKNYGSYFLMPIIIIHFIIIILFYTKNFINKIIEKINDISFSINNSGLKSEEQKISQSKIRRKKRRKSLQQQLFPFNNNQKSKDIDLHSNKNNSIININKNYEMNINKIREETSGNSYNVNKENINKNNSISSKDEISKKIEGIMTYNDEELNSLTYENALKYDKRNYLQFYISLLKTKHDLVSTIFNNNDYNSKIIKIDLFLFNSSLFCVINALFFSDSTMHKIYEDNGSFNFIYQLPQIIYSTFITTIFNFIFKLLALSEDQILDFKKIKEKKGLEIKLANLVKKIKIKFLSYFILSSIFFLFFWYYLSMFCAIYLNTQIHLIKDTLMSFALSLITPLGLFLIPGLLRITSLSNTENKREMLYKVSQILQVSFFC